MPSKLLPDANADLNAFATSLHDVQQHFLHGQSKTLNITSLYALLTQIILHISGYFFNGDLVKRICGIIQ